MYGRCYYAWQYALQLHVDLSVPQSLHLPQECRCHGHQRRGERGRQQLGVDEIGGPIGSGRRIRHEAAHLRPSNQAIRQSGNQAIR